MTLQRVRAAGFSKLATVTWGDNLKVYFQADNLSICELTRHANGDWTGPVAIPGVNAYQGTGLGAVGWDGVHLRVYYQTPDNAQFEAAWDGSSWQIRAMQAKWGDQIRAQLGTPIVAIRLLDEKGVRLVSV